MREKINLVYSLPPELRTRIYQYDPTYKLKYDIAMRQLRFFFCLSIVSFWWIDVLSDNQLGRHLKRVARRHTKQELKDLCRFRKIKIPKHTTKWKLCVKLFVNCSSDNKLSYIAESGAPFGV